jgi:hypothetical protein
MEFGPEYPKINTVFKRDGRNVIVPGDWSTPEFEYLKDSPWRWTEKINGINIRIHWDGKRVVIGGRTDDAQIPAFLVSKLNNEFSTEDFQLVFGNDDANVTLYGECYGSKIQVQKSGQYRNDLGFALFDIKIGDWWLRPNDVKDVATRMGIEMVPRMPFIGDWTLEAAVDIIQNQVVDSYYPNAKLEGTVGTPTVQLFDRSGDRIITKIKVKDFEDLRRKTETGKITAKQFKALGKAPKT